MISLFNLPEPRDIWEGSDYIGLLYYAYPDAVQSMYSCSDEPDMLTSSSPGRAIFLDLSRSVYISPLFASNVIEGDIIAFSLSGIYDPEDPDKYVEEQSVLRRIEDVKRGDLHFVIGGIG